MLTLGVFMILEFLYEGKTFADEKGNSYILLSHSIFSFLSSSVLFIIGYHLKYMIGISLKDSNEKGDMNHYIDDSIISKSGSEVDSEDEGHLHSEPQHSEHQYFESRQSYLKSLQTAQTAENLNVLLHEKNVKEIENHIQIKPEKNYNTEKEVYFTIRKKQINIVTLTFLISDIYQTKLFW